MIKEDQISVGIVGCGTISDVYLRVAKQFRILRIVACADTIIERAQAKALKYSISKVCDVEELLSDPAVDLVLNLTPPNAHAEIAMRALRAGKPIYSEKPLATDRLLARKMLKLAHKRGLRVNCAPDTFLGGGLQTCRNIIDRGLIGEPVAANACMLCHGHESWHPEPEFYYQPGGGPLFDMGPYYLTALITLLGPVRRVTGSARISFPTRLITSRPHAGRRMPVEVPTHVAGTLDFCNGAIATLVTSFDVWTSEVSNIEIYGTEGSLRLPDPNTFGGPVFLRFKDQREWTHVPLTHGYIEESRSIGVAEMAYAMRGARESRTQAELGYHVLVPISNLFDIIKA
jgi:predicted dehydrogenase